MIFEKAEYLKRVQKVRESMSSKGIDVLLITDPANMCYLTGYDAWSFYVHKLVIVTIDDEMPRYVGRHMDAFCGAVKTTWLDESHVHAYSDDYVQSTTKHPMDYIAQILTDKGYANKTVAVEMEAYYFTAGAFVSLQKGLPNAKIVDGTNIVNWVRIVKSEGEIALMKKAGILVDNAIEAATKVLREDGRQCDVASAIFGAIVGGTPEFGGDYPAIVPLIPYNEFAGAPHLTWNEERYPDGSNLYIEIAGCHQHYHCPIARTFTIGNAREKVKKVAEVAIEGLNAVLDTVKPGITCEEVELAYRNVLKKNGLEKDSRIGYSTGLNFPPDWGEHTASLRPGDKTILVPNMTFHCVPGMYYDDFGVSISQTFRVTETGCEPLSNTPRKLIEISRD